VRCYQQFSLPAMPKAKKKKRVPNKLSKNHGYIISESCPPCDQVVGAESLPLELRSWWVLICFVFFINNLYKHYLYQLFAALD